MRENKLTITIEDDGTGVGVHMDGGIGHRSLIIGTCMIVNRVCKVAEISLGQLYAFAALDKKQKPDEERGSWVTIKTGVDWR